MPIKTGNLEAGNSSVGLVPMNALLTPDSRSPTRDPSQKSDSQGGAGLHACNKKRRRNNRGHRRRAAHQGRRQGQDRRRAEIAHPAHALSNAASGPAMQRRVPPTVTAPKPTWLVRKPKAITTLAVISESTRPRSGAKSDNQTLFTTNVVCSTTLYSPFHRLFGCSSPIYRTRILR